MRLPVLALPALPKPSLASTQSHMKSHGRDMFYGFHLLADVFLALSGYLSGNHGRTATGLMNGMRNAAWFPLRKFIRRGHADITTSFIAAATNVPQLLTSVTAPETTAVSLVIGAYVMRGSTRLGRDMLENTNVSARPVRGFLKRTFDDTAGGILIKLPPVMLAGRAIMQTTDGVMRKDYSAVTAGVIFLAAAAGLYYFDNRKTGAPAPDVAPPAPGPA
jgi:hypothetical protein